MQRRLRQVYTSLKEHSSVSYAKIATIGGFCDLDLIVVKATSPDDLPFPDRYVHELLKIFSLSPPSIRAFSISFTRRFGNTQSWRVALKCLVLLHRLIRSLPNESPFRKELNWARTNGLISLYPCQFKDSSSSSPEDYTIFIRSYSRLLDEALDCLSIDSSERELNEEPEILANTMSQINQFLQLLPQFQSLIDRVIDCRPSGSPSRSFLVKSAMKYIIRDSFVCYKTFRHEIVVILDNLFQMPYRSYVAAFGIYKKAAIQSDQLCEFYSWCKSMGLCGSYEYPFVDKIPEIQVRALENFLNGMWQLSESSCSSTGSLLESSLSPSLCSSKEDENELQMVRAEAIVRTQWVNFEENVLTKKLQENEEEKPLIELEVSHDDDGWEAILEASVSPAFGDSRNDPFPNPNGYGYSYGYGYTSGYEANQWQIQLYNPYSQNPFYQPGNVPYYHMVHMRETPNIHGDSGGVQSWPNVSSNCLNSFEN